jgi:hypothetical protein
MLQKRSSDALECLQHATECELLAERATHPAAKLSLLDIAERWRRIAGTCEYNDRVDRSLGKASTATSG